MLILLERVLPLYVLIAFGYIAATRLNVRKEAIAPLLLYFVMPVVMCVGIWNTPLTPARTALPLLMLLLCCMTALIARAVNNAKPVRERQALAFLGGNCNSGYFGLPMALALFGEAGFGLALLLSMGFITYENTLGFYLVARGEHPPREAFIRLFRMPALYAFTAGALLNFTGVPIPQSVLDFAQPFRGSYTVLGMMMVGMAVAGITRAHIDWSFLGRSLAFKFLLWPVVTALVIALDAHTLHAFDLQTRHSLLLAAVLPLAANSVAFATLFNAAPEKTSLSVLLSTVFALGYIPVFAALFLH